uniref:Guanine nucleotide-binding protein subunit beta-like protein 1 n=1 Tax=Caligus rogercresseyi TaxID=217165 RepID=C1BPZ6_CALRO|nr:Guanine nucleotide-binding protein subunit beta-like protein 1 [Caligus rogercresseyi]
MKMITSPSNEERYRISPIRVLSASSPVTLLEFSNDGTRLLAGCDDGTLSIWNTRSWKREASQSLGSTIQWIVESSSEYLIQTREGALFMNPHLKTFSLNPKDSCTHLGFCKAHLNGQVLAAPHNEADVWVRTLHAPNRSLTHIVTLEKGSSGMICALKIIALGKRLLATYEIGKIILWDLEGSHEQLHCLDILQSAWALDWDPVCSSGLLSGPAKEVVSFKLNDSSDQLRLLKSRSLPTEGISDIKIRSRPKHKLAIASSWDGTLRLFSWAFPSKLKALGALKFHTEALNCLAASRVPIKVEGKEVFLFAGGSKDERISLWNVYNE